MKKLICAIILMFNFSAFAQCTFSLVKPELNYIGYPLRLVSAFEYALRDNGCQYTKDQTKSLVHIDLDFKLVDHRYFQHVVAELKANCHDKNINQTIDKLCLTQYCSLDNVVQSLSKAIDQFKKDFPKTCL